MKIEIVERQPVRVAYLRYIGPAGVGIGRFWRATVTPWLADHGLLDCPRYGVSLDNPRETPPENCRYDACVELPRGLDIPDAEQTTDCRRQLCHHALQRYGRGDRRGLGRVRRGDAGGRPEQAG